MNPVPKGLLAELARASEENLTKLIDSYSTFISGRKNGEIALKYWRKEHSDTKFAPYEKRRYLFFHSLIYAHWVYKRWEDTEPLTFNYYNEEFEIHPTNTTKQMEVDMADKTEVLNLVNELLKSVGETREDSGKVKELEKKLKSKDAEISKAYEEAKTALALMEEAEGKVKTAIENEQFMREKLEELILKPTVSTEPVPAIGNIPAGGIVMKSVKKVFTSVKWDQDFEVPVWEWDAPHPRVPAVDPNYIFRKDELSKVLFALITNQRCYLQGHTGSGKTTLVEQVCAMLQWPFMIVNFDSGISRMDLVGRETLTVAEDSEGRQTTVSKFVEGIIPQAMQGPHVLCCDEIDFVLPDVAYVMQRVFEGNNFTLAEDGGRVINPDPNFRMFATGNTVGQGDEEGMYQGARPQSLAMLDRFTVWIRVDYLDSKQRKQLIQSVAPTLRVETVDKLNQYVQEHIKAFLKAEILQPISPRGFLSIAKAVTSLNKMSKDSEKKNLEKALTMCVLDRATSTDKRVLKELVQRTV